MLDEKWWETVDLLIKPSEPIISPVLWTVEPPAQQMARFTSECLQLFSMSTRLKVCLKIVKLLFVNNQCPVANDATCTAMDLFLIKSTILRPIHKQREAMSEFCNIFCPNCVKKQSLVLQQLAQFRGASGMFLQRHGYNCSKKMTAHSR